MAGQHALLVPALLALAAAPLAAVTDAAAREETGKLAAELGALRRIPLRGPLGTNVVSREEARAQVERALTAALAGSEMAVEERILQRLNLLPRTSDYARLLVDSYAASPTALYDAGTRTLLVPSWLPLERQRPALAHEIAHALEDQRFGLRRTLQIGPDGRHRLDGDAERARQALIEGDATTAALELADPRGVFLGGRELPALAERLRAASAAAAAGWEPWLRTVSLFTHVDGLLFVARARARESWALVDALWAAPPDTSEQVLHPEKYDAREPAVRIEVAPLRALEPGFHPAGGDVLGELGVRAWLASALSPEVAARAAAGWGGDRAVLYLPADDLPRDAAAPEPALAWLTVWDEPADAEDFARAAPAALAKLAGEREVPSLDAAGHLAIRAPTGLFALTWRRDTVALLIGAPDTAEPALAEMLEKWRRLKPPRKGRER